MTVEVAVTVICEVCDRSASFEWDWEDDAEQTLGQAITNARTQLAGLGWVAGEFPGADPVDVLDTCPDCVANPGAPVVEQTT